MYTHFFLYASFPLKNTVCHWHCLNLLRETHKSIHTVNGLLPVTIHNNSPGNTCQCWKKFNRTLERISQYTLLLRTFGFPRLLQAPCDGKVLFVDELHRGPCLKYNRKSKYWCSSHSRKWPLEVTQVTCWEAASTGTNSTAHSQTWAQSSGDIWRFIAGLEHKQERGIRGMIFKKTHTELKPRTDSQTKCFFSSIWPFGSNLKVNAVNLGLYMSSHSLRSNLWCLTLKTLAHLEL